MKSLKWNVRTGCAFAAAAFLVSAAHAERLVKEAQFKHVEGNEKQEASSMTALTGKEAEAAQKSSDKLTNWVDPITKKKVDGTKPMTAEEKSSQKSRHQVLYVSYDRYEPVVAYSGYLSSYNYYPTYNSYSSYSSSYSSYQSSSYYGSGGYYGYGNGGYSYSSYNSSYSSSSYSYTSAPGYYASESSYYAYARRSTNVYYDGRPYLTARY